MEITPEKEPTFVPNYIREPDLAKAWSLPGDGPAALPPASIPYNARVHSNMDLAHDGIGNSPIPSAVTTTPPHPPSQPRPTEQVLASPTLHDHHGPGKRELLVYNSNLDDAALLGSVWVETSDSIDATIAQIQRELDDIPMDFTVSRHNGERAIPVNKKQRSLNTLEFFQSSDALIIKQR